VNLKERLHAGAAVHIGALAVDTPLDQLEGKIAGQGWDLAFVDLQHAPYTEPQWVALCQRATALGLPLMPRAPHPSAPWLIGRLLDGGAAAVLVPMVEAESVVEAAVENVYYPPVGRRSCGLRYALGWSGSGLTPRGYADWWNANAILALQIETVEGVLNCRRLYRPGVDLILFGSTDLTFSLEAHPEGPFRTVAECHQHVVSQMAGLDVRVCPADLPFGRFAAVAGRSG